MGKNLIFLLLFCFYQSCSFNNTRNNLVLNSSFEVGQGEEPDGWIKMITKDVKSYHLGISRTEHHSDSASYEIVAELKKLADEARTDLGDDIQNVKGQNRREPGRISEN